MQPMISSHAATIHRLECKRWSPQAQALLGGRRHAFNLSFEFCGFAEDQYLELLVVVLCGELCLPFEQVQFKFKGPIAAFRNRERCDVVYDLLKANPPVILHAPSKRVSQFVTLVFQHGAWLQTPFRYMKIIWHLN